MKRKKRTKQWFSNPVFQGLEEEEDEQEEIENTASSYQAQGGRLLNATEEEEQMEDEKVEKEEEEEEKEESSDSDSSDDADKETGGDKFETVPLDIRPPQVRKLDPEGLALGAVMVQSKKKREELVDSAYNRWTHNDPDNLPGWFVDDETEHCQKQLPVTREMVEEYQRKLREINARPIKKIAEAKSRKKRRALKKLVTARRKAEIICDTGDVTDQEKVRQLKSVYKKAGLMGGRKKQEVKYVVAKKGIGKRVHRPAGVSGRFKVVDPRMKKDKRAKSKGKGRNRNKKY